MKTRIRKQSKKTIYAVAGLSVLSLGAIGSAAWIISRPAETKEVGNISAVVGEVIDRKLNYSATIDSNNNSIRFDANEGGSLIKWSGAEGETEDMSFVVNLDVTSPATTPSWEDFNTRFATFTVKTWMTIDTTDAAGIALENALTQTNPYITFISTKEKDGEVDKRESVNLPTYTAETGSTEKGTIATDPVDTNDHISVTASEAPTGVGIRYAITFSFGWGSFFGGHNPSSLTDGSSLDTYVGGLQELRKANNAKFKINLTVENA
ncbi:MAG: hypothetical protein ACI32C_02710 [Candidatus Enteromonas sp.]